MNKTDEQKCDCRTCVNANNYVVCSLNIQDIANIEVCDFCQEDVEDIAVTKT